MDSVLHTPLKFEESELAQLIAALTSNYIQVSEEDVKNLVEKREWIYPSARVVKMQEKLGIDSMNGLYDLFDHDHHIRSAAKLFRFMASDKVAVIYGHKAQGKSQFLYFVFKLLKSLREKVIFLDRTILPTNLTISSKSSEENFCANMWRDSFKENGTVTDCLDKFHENPQPQLFGQFLSAVLEDIKKSKMRVWIIIDEVVLFENFPINLPEEQEMSPFNWIVTGSAGIGSWVSIRHLGDNVIDLPLFTKTEVKTFADKLSRCLNIDLADAIAIPQQGVEDWLEERFGGVIGYVTEMFLELPGHSVGEVFVSKFMTRLRRRVNELIINTAKKWRISPKELCESWLTQMNDEADPWIGVRDAGLCGNECPRGIMFSILLKVVCSYCKEENELGLVSSFRKRFKKDAGLNGCLLEHEEILKLKQHNHRIQAAPITLLGNSWIINPLVHIPPQECDTRCIFKYIEADACLVSDSRSEFQDSRWSLVILPVCFDVIDIVLVDCCLESPTIYGIQITQSKKPFSNHQTFETCSDSSKKRLEALWAVIIDSFSLIEEEEEEVEKVYVMLAPNCEGQDFRPPARHSKEFLFSPPPAETTVDTISMHPKRKSRGLKAAPVLKRPR